MLTCYTCGASVQSDASFCGQCGANLNLHPNSTAYETESTSSSETQYDDTPSTPDTPSSPQERVDSIDIPDVTVPDLVEFDPLMEPEPLTADVPELSPLTSAATNKIASNVETEASTPEEEPFTSSSLPPQTPSPVIESTSDRDELPPDIAAQTLNPTLAEAQATPPIVKATQIQTQSAQLLHTHSNTIIEVPPHLNIIHIGKPNDRVPPDVDVSGFPESEVVSRVHADIRVEGNYYYIEDVGSSNGTYINNIPLAPGNRHKLRSGDRIALGKGDKVSFIIQIT